MGAGLAALVLVYIYAHYAFASMTAHVTALYPAFFGAALAIGAPPLLAALALAYFSNLNAGLTHYGTGSAPVFFGAGYVGAGHVVEARLSDFAGEYRHLAGGGLGVVEADRDVVSGGPESIGRPPASQLHTAQIGRQVGHLRTAEARPGNLLLPHAAGHHRPVLGESGHHFEG